MIMIDQYCYIDGW